jgi:hypothetical protein
MSPTARHMLVGAALIAIGALLGASLSSAEAKDPTVVCSQVGHATNGNLDEAYIANFMSEQVLAGRVRFQSLEGRTTVICAY